MTALIIVLILVLVPIVVFVGTILVRPLIFRARKRKLGSPIEHYTEAQKLAYANNLSKWLQCKTVSRKGAPHDDTEFAKLRDINREMFPNIFRAAEIMSFSDDCWIYKIGGKDTTRNIMLMSHHDVVEASGEWLHPPFGGEIADGAIWGRGAVDTKTPVFAEMTALEELLSEGFTPQVNVYIGSSHNEEICGDGIPTALQYFKDNDINFELVLDEGGAIIAPPLPGMTDKCAMLATHEKGRLSMTFKTSEVAHHAGLQFKNQNPVQRMSSFIDEISNTKPFITTLPREVKAMFRALAPYMNYGMGLVFSNIWLFGGLLQRIMPAINPQGGAMLGTTCKFTSIIGGKENKGNESTCVATAFLQCVYKAELDQDLVKLNEIAAKHGVETIIDSNEYHAPSSMDKAAFAMVEDTVHNVFPHAITSPFILPAGSDSRHLVDVCDCVVRFAPIEISPSQFASVHGDNENIDVSAVANCVKFYKELVLNYK